jgi:predicted DNA-binding protein (MmcQ/YjbR family)
MLKDDSKAVRALVTELRKLCAKLPGSEEYVMVHHPAFRVGKKPFVIAGMQQDQLGATLSINLGHDAQSGLLDDARFTKTPYIGQHGWITIARNDIEVGELAALVTGSWRRIASTKALAAFEGTARTPAKKRVSR